VDEKIYHKFVAPYTYAMNLIMAHLKNVQEELLMSPTIRNPIDAIYGRIKTLDSLNKKCQDSRYNINPDDIAKIRDEVLDIAGIRITCVYPEDIPEIKGYIDRMPGVFIRQEKDYINNPKPSGYQSLHLIVLIDTSTITSGLLKIPVEIQIRTLSMQSWAQVEHRARYKGKKPVSAELEEKIQQAARLAAELDQLYGEILTISEE